MFQDYLKSDLRIKKLPYILDNNANLNLTVDESERSEDKFKVRDILINRIDTIYYSKTNFINLTKPIEILKKLKDEKKYETRTSSITARKDLLTMKYLPSKESASDFYDRSRKNKKK